MRGNEHQPAENPPSYDEAAYLPSRKPPVSRPEPELEHTIDIRVLRASPSVPLAIPFPTDEKTWTLARDVQHADWERFVSDLAEARAMEAGGGKEADKGEPSNEQVLRMREGITLWNRNFFEPRGCKILAAGFEGEPTVESQGERMEFSNEGIRFKRVRGMFGLSFPGGNFFGFGIGKIS